MPIPSLVSATNAADCVVFGLGKSEIAEMRKRFPYMADAACTPGTYRGQNAIVETVAAWNVVVAHKDMEEGAAFNIVKAALTAKDLPALAGAAASSTKAANASKNAVVPYHAGAIRALAALGVNAR